MDMRMEGWMGGSIKEETADGEWKKEVDRRIDRNFKS